MLLRIIGERVQLVVRAAPDVGHIRADVGSLVQVLMNLAVNARDAMPDGGTLTFGTSAMTLEQGYDDGPAGPSAPSGRYVVLTVSDTGCGMAPSVLRHLFEPFFTTKEVGKGTGLGLCTVYGIVKQSDGHIDVTSAPGQGTTFRLFFPRADEPAKAASLAVSVAPPASSSETILLAEDDEGIRELVARVLRRAGYRVIVSSDGDEALALHAGREEHVHLLLVDVGLPGVAGPELAQQIAARSPRTKVLFTSAYLNPELDGCGVATSQARLLKKPFTSSELLWTVREVLDQDGEA